MAQRLSSLIILGSENLTTKNGLQTMAQHKSAKKRIRQTIARTAVNRSRISRIRTFIKKVETAIAAGNPSDAMAALKSAQPEIMRGVSKGVLPLATASRKVSRLSSRVKALKTAA